LFDGPPAPRRAAAAALAAALAIVPGPRAPGQPAAGAPVAPAWRSPAKAAAPPPAGADTVILVSVDGLRWDFPERARAPHLRRMAAEGASARLVPPFPANTFPAHATLATGVHPDRHGMVNNEFLDRERGVFRMDDDPSWLLAEPLWVTAERQGARAAVYHWVASAAPWRGIGASIRHPFDRAVRDADKAEAIVGWLNLPDRDRPRLILSYWRGPDDAGHRHGPDSPEVDRRVRETDRLLGRVLEAIARTGLAAALIVVSDHGMAAVDRVLRLDRLLQAAGGGARGLSSGAAANVYCEAAGCGRAEEALRRLPGALVHRQDDLPPALRYASRSRTGDLVAIAPPGSYFADGESRRPPARGMHGYGPDRPEMHGVFRAWGAGIRRGAARDRLHAVDVAPLVCRLLGIAAPAGVDGRVPADFLEPVRGRGTPASRPAPPPWRGPP
jgi:predicted AlkP superfamily pyrophosphatase or phosphodiesterase